MIREILFLQIRTTGGDGLVKGRNVGCSFRDDGVSEVLSGWCKDVVKIKIVGAEGGRFSQQTDNSFYKWLTTYYVRS